MVIFSCSLCYLFQNHNPLGAVAVFVHWNSPIFSLHLPLRPSLSPFGGRQCAKHPSFFEISLAIDNLKLFFFLPFLFLSLLPTYMKMYICIISNFFGSCFKQQRCIPQSMSWPWLHGWPHVSSLFWDLS